MAMHAASNAQADLVINDRLADSTLVIVTAEPLRWDQVTRRSG